jgi:hypothetical protein
LLEHRHQFHAYIIIIRNQDRQFLFRLLCHFNVQNYAFSLNNQAYKTQK